MQNRNLHPILTKAAEIRDSDEYAVFRTYILNQFDIRLEQRNVREIKTQREHFVSAETKAEADITETA